MIEYNRRARLGESYSRGSGGVAGRGCAADHVSTLFTRGAQVAERRQQPNYRAPRDGGRASGIPSDGPARTRRLPVSGHLHHPPFKVVSTSVVTADLLRYWFSLFVKTGLE